MRPLLNGGTLGGRHEPATLGGQMRRDQPYADFITAMSASFGDHLCPPVPDDDASPHECCEAIWSLLGTDITPEILASLDDSGLDALGVAVGRYFEVSAPTREQIRAAVAATLCRWPPGSLPAPQPAAETP
jgi:hypothetical protein